MDPGGGFTPGGAEDIKAVEGFWLRRPWMTEEGCRAGAATLIDGPSALSWWRAAVWLRGRAWRGLGQVAKLTVAMRFRTSLGAAS